MDMDSKHAFESIDKPTFEWILTHYSSSLITADDGDQLDEQRYKNIPEAVKARQGDLHLNKEDLVTLMTWKLKHGVFRPALKGMVQQNSAKDVQQTTRKSFAQHSNGSSKDAIKSLAGLRGVGPATASLILSVYDPEKAPFFSDELFRWAFFQSGKGNGWDRRIKYTAKEYAELSGKVTELVTRLDVSAVDAERVAYVLGRDGMNGQAAKEEPKKSYKRKAKEADGEATAFPASKDITTSELPEKLQSDGKKVAAAEETVKSQRADLSSRSQPKRKRTKRAA